MILLTGGSGNLGLELSKLIGCHAPTHEEFDIAKDNLSQNSAWRNQMFKGVRLIVHCASYTLVDGAEHNKELCYETNVLGTRNIASLNIPILYISTSYVFDGKKGNYAEKDYPNPINFYGLTKLLGEHEALRKKGKVIRCLFKPRPFKHDRAPTDQITSGMYAEEIAKEIALAVQYFDKLPQIIHIGGSPLTTYELARQSREVKPCLLRDIATVQLPRDTSLNSTQWKELKCKLISQERITE